MQTYTPGDMIRLEILQYQNPEGLHEVELNWRNLARKLMQHNKEMQQVIEAHNKRLGYASKDCNICKQHNYIPFKFPAAFTQESAVAEDLQTISLSIFGRD